MSGLRLLTLGVGDAFSRFHYSTCFALEAEGSWLLIDCPHPIRKMLREASDCTGLDLDIGSIHAVALTHVHADHVSGLEGFAFFSRFMLGRRARLLAHPNVSEHLWEGYLAAGMRWSHEEPGKPPVERQFSDFFDLQPLQEAGPVTIGPFTVSCRLTVHSVPTTALLIDAGGRKLGYSADAAFEPALIDWLSPADLIVHEAGEGFLHTRFERLAALPAALRAKMRVVHSPDNFEPSDRVIESLRQGVCYSV